MKQYLGYFPSIQLSATVSPITRTVLKVAPVYTSYFLSLIFFLGLLLLVLKIPNQGEAFCRNKFTKFSV